MDMTAFLMNSPLARRIRLPGRVVICRPRLSLQDTVTIKEQGKWELIPATKTAPQPPSPEFSPAAAYHAAGLCELEVNGVVIARGKIVKKRAGYYFKVTELATEKPELTGEED